MVRSSIAFALVLCAAVVGPAGAATEYVDTTEHPVTYPFGVMMLGLALLAVPFHYMKQSNIIAWYVGLPKRNSAFSLASYCTAYELWRWSDNIFVVTAASSLELWLEHSILMTR